MSTEYTPTTVEVRTAYGDQFCRNPEGQHDKGCPADLEFDRWFAAEIAKAQEEQRNADAQIIERFVDHYPEDIFTPEGTTMDAHSARVIRIMAPAWAAAIRESDTPT